MTLEILRSDMLDHPHGFFTRKGGASSGVFQGLNCGYGSTDQAEVVQINRGRVAEAMGVGEDRLVTVHQTHSAEAIEIRGPHTNGVPRVDAMVTATPGVALGVLSADCQPVLFADRNAGVVGAAHAGWRGALGGRLGSDTGCDGSARRETRKDHGCHRPDDQPGGI